MTNAQKLAQKIESDGQKTVAFFREIQPADWQKQLYADGNQWTVLEVFTHITIAERDLLRLFKRISDGGDGVAPDFDLDQNNHERVERAVENTPELNIEAFTKNRAATVSWVANLADGDLAKEGRHPYLGIATIEEMLKLLYRHVQLHQRDIRKMLKGM